MVFIPAFIVYSAPTLVQVLRGQLNSFLTYWSVDWDSVYSDPEDRRGDPTYWHLYTGGVVVVVILAERRRVTLTNVQLLKDFNINALLGSREPGVDSCTRGGYAASSSALSADVLAARDKSRTVTNMCSDKYIGQLQSYN